MIFHQLPNLRRDRFGLILIFALFMLVIQSCTVKKGLVIQDSLTRAIEQDSVLGKAWVGVSIYDADRDRYLFDYNSDKKFVPASNTKLLTTYASLKYLPDSIPGWYWQETADSLYLYPNGDPTFFHRDFEMQPLLSLIDQKRKPVVIAMDEQQQFRRFGAGWPWDYFQSPSVPERSQMPMYGNFARLELDKGRFSIVPSYFNEQMEVDPEAVNAAQNEDPASTKQGYVLSRTERDNQFRVIASTRRTMARPFTHQTDPFLAFRLLEDTLRKTHPTISLSLAVNKARPDVGSEADLRTLFTAEKDRVLGIMMKRSDNFIAEQLLLMVGAELTGGLTDRGAITHLMQKDLADLPDQPSWADGSGLSRNNQFSPRFYVELLRQIENEFGTQRIRGILPHGNEGTLLGYYAGMEDQLFAKTGTLSGTAALSGYIVTDAGKNLVFSVLVNHHQNSAVAARRAIERFVRSVIETH